MKLSYLLFGEDRTASKTLRKVGDEAGHTGSRLEGMGSRASGALAMLGGAAATAAIAGVAAISAGVVKGIGDAAEYQQLAAKTAAVLASTGNAAGQSVKGIQERAAALESLSGVDETVIINGQNVLATFTKVQDKVGAGNDVFSQATAAALDMSVALGTDLQGANIQLGKALNDPVKGITALGRAGVSFTEQQKDQIKTLVKHGDTLGAQKIILGELSKEFGGAAKAAGEGFSGSMERAKDAVGDAFREVGTHLLPVLTDLADWFATEGMPKIVAFAQEAWPKVQSAFAVVADVISNKVVPAVKIIVGWFQEHVIPVAKELGEKVLGGLKTAWDSISQAIEENRPQLEAIGLTLKTMAEWIMANVVPVIGTVLKWAFEQVGDIIGEVITVIGHLQTGFQTLAQWGIWLWNNALQPTIQFILGGFSSLTRGFETFLRALANVPGFGWAKDAADKMGGAADEADRIGRNLNKIPENVPVTISMSIVGVQAVKNAINGIGGSMSAQLNARLQFASGGYTGNLPQSDIAGVVHGQEFVMDAAATRRLGVPFLEALQSGRTVDAPRGFTTASTHVGPSAESIGDAVASRLDGLAIRITNIDAITRAGHAQLLTAMGRA
ncbi:MAG: hypothetical protein WAT71_11430 [Ignavibacteria bacterium]